MKPLAIHVATRRGIVLAAVLVLTAMAGMVAAGLLFRMRAEVTASAAGTRGQQAYFAAMSGVQRVLTVLQAGRDDPQTWMDRPDIFQNQLVFDDGANKWYFTVYAANPEDRKTVRFGPSDEAARININVADEATLLKMPNMTQDLADCLLDWRDSDNDPRPRGAEQEYYSGLPIPYLVKNGPLMTVEELLLVKGFNGSIVYGEDVNFNGMLDKNEDDGDESFPPDNADGQLDAGLRGVAATMSYEPDMDRQGNPRIDLNSPSADLAAAGLGQQTVNFVRVYLSEGNRFSHPSELLNMQYRLQKDYTPGAAAGAASEPGGQEPNTPSESKPSGGPLKAGTTIESGVGAAELPLVLDKFTARSGPGNVRVGLVNVNTASAAALMLLEGIDSNLAAKILDVRATLDADTKSTIAWLFAQNVLPAEAFKSIAPKLTARSFQFRVQCIGFGWPCGQYRVIEAVIDLAGGRPRVAYQRDITRLGLPLAINME